MVDVGVRGRRSLDADNRRRIGTPGGRVIAAANHRPRVSRARRQVFDPMVDVVRASRRSRICSEVESLDVTFRKEAADRDGQLRGLSE